MCLEMENQVDALSLHGTVLWGSEGATGMAFVKTARIFPMSSRAKAKPISDSGRGNLFKKGENVLQESNCSWR